MAVLIWGTVTILPYASSGQSCNRGPVAMAFALIVFNWALLPTQCCIICWCLIGGFLRTMCLFGGKTHLANAGAL